MYEIIRQLIAYNGSQNLNIDNSILQVCQVLIPMLFAFFAWQFTHLITFIVSWGRK